MQTDGQGVRGDGEDSGGLLAGKVIFCHGVTGFGFGFFFGKYLIANQFNK